MTTPLAEELPGKLPARLLTGRRPHGIARSGRIPAGRSGLVFHRSTRGPPRTPRLRVRPAVLPNSTPPNDPRHRWYQTTGDGSQSVANAVDSGALKPWIDILTQTRTELVEGLIARFP